MINLFAFAEGGMGSLWIYGILIVVMLLMIFIPGRRQKKYEQEQAMMRNSLQVGDEVTTIGGIIGKVTSLKGETVTIETSKDKTKIRFLRNAIRSVDVKAEESIALRSMPAEEPEAVSDEAAAPAIEAAPLADESAKKTPKKRAPKAKAPEAVAETVENVEPVADVVEPAAEAERTTLLNGEEISAE